MQIKQRSFKISVFACVILILFVLFIIGSTTLFCWDFRNNLWGPAYLLTHHQSPYRVDRLFDLGSAVWLPMAIGAFFPLGFLSLQQASNLWFVLNVIWFLMIVWISSGPRRPTVFLFGLAVFLSFLFPPVVTHFWSGQISILITLIFLITGIWHDKMPATLLATLIAVGLSKPQLAILVLPGFLSYRLKEYGWLKTLQLVMILIGCILLLTAPLFLAYPNWFPDFILELQGNPSWAHPSSLNFLRGAASGIGIGIWSMLALVIFGISIWLWTTRPNRDAVYWTLALTPLITPYIWTWDFVMVLPLFISYLLHAKMKVSLAVLLAGYIACWSLITGMKLAGQVNESLFWWVPWLLLATVLVSRYLKIQPAFRQNSAGMPEINRENGKGRVRLDHVEMGR